MKIPRDYDPRSERPDHEAETFRRIEAKRRSAMPYRADLDEQWRRRCRRELRWATWRNVAIVVGLCVAFIVAAFRLLALLLEWVV